MDSFVETSIQAIREKVGSGKVLLALSGIMIVHNYSLAKTLLTLILTVVAMLIIVFIAMLLSDLVNQVYGFIYSIYMELLFRG